MLKTIIEDVINFALLLIAVVSYAAGFNAGIAGSWTGTLLGFGVFAGVVPIINRRLGK